VARPNEYLYVPTSVKKSSHNIVANQSSSTSYKARFAMAFVVRIMEIGHGYQDQGFTTSIFAVRALALAGNDPFEAAITSLHMS
jgi:hypothetical protein